MKNIINKKTSKIILITFITTYLFCIVIVVLAKINYNLDNFISRNLSIPLRLIDDNLVYKYVSPGIINKVNDISSGNLYPGNLSITTIISTSSFATVTITTFPEPPKPVNLEVVTNFCTSLKGKNEFVSYVENKNKYYIDNLIIWESKYVSFSVPQYIGKLSDSVNQSYLNLGLDYKSNPNEYCAISIEKKNILYKIVDKHLVEIADLDLIYGNKLTTGRTFVVIFSSGEDYIVSSVSVSTGPDSYEIELFGYDINTHNILKLKSINLPYDGMASFTVNSKYYYLLQDKNNNLYLYDFRNKVRYFVAKLSSQNEFGFKMVGGDLIQTIENDKSKYFKIVDILKTHSESIFE